MSCARFRRDRLDQTTLAAFLGTAVYALLVLRSVRGDHVPDLSVTVALVFVSTSLFELKDYEFNAHGVEFNQRYRSTAIVSDGSEEPPYTRDPQLHHAPTTWPGARLPHCWVEHRGRRLSTLDLAGGGRFVLLTGIGGEAWRDAADTVGDELDLDVAAYVVGPGREVLDLFGDWAGLREVDERGCVLVRPDGHVGWRSHDLVADPTAELRRVMRLLLGRAPSPSATAETARFGLAPA